MRSTRVCTGRGWQVAYLRYGRLVVLTLAGTTVDVNGTEEVLSRRYQPRMLLGSTGCREAPTQRFVSDLVAEVLLRREWVPTADLPHGRGFCVRRSITNTAHTPEKNENL